MNRTILNLLGLAGIAALSLIGWAAFGLHQTEDAISDAAKSGKITVQIDTSPKVTERLVKLFDAANPAISKADTAFGNLADASGDWSDASKQQARDVRALLAAGGRAVDAVTEDAKALKGTATGATVLLATANTDLVTAQPALAALPPLLTAYTQSGNDLDALLRDKAITATLTNVQAMTAQGAGILGDVRQETDSMVAPKSRGQRIWGYAPTTVKLGAEVTCIAFHVPCP
jgi:hypothetical protein